MRKLKIFIFLLTITVCGGLIGGSIQSAWAKALLIEDILPWGFNSNSQTLTDIGIPFDKIGSGALASQDLSGYKFIVYASDQPQSYYNNISANFSKIDDFVENGGILIAHSCIWGWQDGSWIGLDFLPGDLSAINQYSNSVSITDPASPIVSGPYGTLTLGDFQAWNYSTHGYFTGLLPGTQVALDLNDPNKPIYITYPWGSGEVRATMMTVEWGNNDPNNTRYIFRQNEFYAGQNIPPGGGGKQVPEPMTMALLGLALCGLVGIRKMM